MNRRGFFGRMFGAIVAAKIAPQIAPIGATTPEPFDWKTYSSSITTGRMQCLHFYQLTARDPHVNHLAMLKEIEAEWFPK